ncbi:GNAT family N-acetyltransferase [Bradyrhizobium sp.]|jgi:GNAT superfamily N-acetyltransferase|uniref:GNAT family N-acetyltransferase n=1 Tax=Bradyrhizobium sp. TaxID=376 RepID=UPI002DDDA8C1|nr:GNAT family N-acetyltransferase [Bradyrhizobium sp.]HEV2155406.1 GNAT family N-acetyltransferase [Bradyrhizobium sp.]
MIKIRLGMPEEEDLFVGLARQMLAESYPDQVFSEPVARETYQRYLNTAHPTFFFADQDGDVIGVLQAGISSYDFSDGVFTTLCGTFVRPDKRGTRAAAMLIAEYCRWSDGLGAVESTGGNDNNLTTERTTRLLGHFGFEPVGTFVRRKFGARNVKKGR